MQNIQQSTSDILNSLLYLKPEWTLIIGFLFVILIDLFVKKSKWLVLITAMLTLVISALFLLIQDIGESQILFNGMYSLTSAGTKFKLLSLFVSGINLIFFYRDERLIAHPKGINDFIVVFLAAVLGIFLLVSSANLLMLFLSLEMISLASYLMVAYNSYEGKQAEGSLKYVLFGGVCSALMLYGISLLYGFTGSIDLLGSGLLSGIGEISQSGVLLALFLLMVGIGFKLSIIPFHFWTPDAYEAAPISVTSFIATGPKIAVFGLLFMILPSLKTFGNGIFHQFILVVAAASMILGNVVAVFQNNPKRMMAYSGIGHTGFLLMLLLLPQAQILSALLFYLMSYALATSATFMALSYLEKYFGLTEINQYKGLGTQIPVLGICLVVLMVSLTGLPPTAGFIAKFLVFSSLVGFAVAGKGIWLLLVVASVTTLISLFYYLKIPLNLFLKPSQETLIKRKTDLILYCGVIFLSMLILILGLYPMMF